jgi:hypothetical protein
MQREFWIFLLSDESLVAKSPRYLCVIACEPNSVEDHRICMYMRRKFLAVTMTSRHLDDWINACNQQWLLNCMNHLPQLSACIRFPFPPFEMFWAFWRISVALEYFDSASMKQTGSLECVHCGDTPRGSFCNWFAGCFSEPLWTSLIFNAQHFFTFLFAHVASQRARSDPLLAVRLWNFSTRSCWPREKMTRCSCAHRARSAHLPHALLLFHLRQC